MSLNCLSEYIFTINISRFASRVRPYRSHSHIHILVHTFNRVDAYISIQWADSRNLCSSSVWHFPPSCIERVGRRGWIFARRQMNLLGALAIEGARAMCGDCVCVCVCACIMLKFDLSTKVLSPSLSEGEWVFVCLPLYMNAHSPKSDKYYKT